MTTSPFLSGESGDRSLIFTIEQPPTGCGDTKLWVNDKIQRFFRFDLHTDADTIKQLIQSKVWSVEEAFYRHTSGIPFLLRISLMILKRR